MSPFGPLAAPFDAPYAPCVSVHCTPGSVVLVVLLVAVLVVWLVEVVELVVLLVGGLCAVDDVVLSVVDVVLSLVEVLLSLVEVLLSLVDVELSVVTDVVVLSSVGVVTDVSV